MISVRVCSVQRTTRTVRTNRTVTNDFFLDLPVGERLRAELDVGDIRIVAAPTVASSSCVPSRPAGGQPSAGGARAAPFRVRVSRPWVVRFWPCGTLQHTRSAAVPLQDLQADAADLLGCPLPRCGRFRSDDIQACRRRGIYDLVVRTPLVRLDLPDALAARLAGSEIFLKLETLQPIGSFKIRGAHNVVRQLTPRRRCATASGRSAPATPRRASRWPRAHAGVPCSVMVMDTAPPTKSTRSSGSARRSSAPPTTSAGGPSKRTRSDRDARPLRASVRRRPLHRRQRHARARDPRGPARRRRRRRRRSAAAGC